MDDSFSSVIIIIQSPPFRLLLLLCCAAAAAMRFSESDILLPRADMAGGRRNADEDEGEAAANGAPMPPMPPPMASTADFLLRVAATEAACWPYPEEPVPPRRIMRISQQLMFCAGRARVHDQSMLFFNGQIWHNSEYFSF